MAVAAQNRSAHDGLPANPAVGPDDGAVDHGAFVHVGLTSQNRIGHHARAGLEHDAFVNEARAVELDALLDTGLGRDPGRVGRTDKGRRRVLAVHDVAVHLEVFRRRADVDPVAVVDVRHEGLAALDQRRKVAALDRPGRVLRNAIERLGLEDVDAGVDRVAGDLVLARLLEETLDVGNRVRLDEPVGPRVLDRCQDDGGLGLALPVEPEHCAEIHLGQHVPIEHDDGFGQRVARIADRATGPERHGFDDVAELDSETFALAEDFFDSARLIVQAENHLVYLWHLAQQVDLVVEERPVEDRHDGLRRVDGEGSQASALTASEQDGLHSNPR